MGFTTAQAPAILLARLRGNHVKVGETWQPAHMITTASFPFFFLFCPDLCLLPIYAFSSALVWA